MNKKFVIQLVLSHHTKCFLQSRFQLVKLETFDFSLLKQTSEILTIVFFSCPAHSVTRTRVWQWVGSLIMMSNAGVCAIARVKSIPMKFWYCRKIDHNHRKRSKSDASNRVKRRWLEIWFCYSKIFIRFWKMYVPCVKEILYFVDSMMDDG